jgi:hypothetical protein
MLSVQPDRIGVSELTVFGIVAVELEPDFEAARGEIAARRYIVAGEEVNG